MFPNNGQQNRSQLGQPQSGAPPTFNMQSPSTPHSAGFDPGSSQFHLDSSLAKQMAALNAANLSRIANNRPPATPLAGGGTSSGPFLGGMPSINPSNGLPTGQDGARAGPHSNFQAPQQQHQQQHQHHNVNPVTNAPFPGAHPSSQPNPAMQGSQQYKQRQRNFLTGLANTMSSRNMPLPPNLTGVPYPNGYDPSNSPWKNLELSTNDIGAIRLAGRDLDLFKLWGTVFQNGGGRSLSQHDTWGDMLKQFDLPEYMPSPQSNGQTSTAVVLAQYYNALLQPFEDAYKRNIADQQRRAAAAAQQQAGNQAPPPAPGPSGQVRPPQPGGPMNHNMPAPNRMPNPSNMMGMGGQPGPPPQHPQHFPQPPVNGAVPIPPSPSLANTPQMRPSSSMNMRQSQHNTPQSIARAPSMESMPSSNGQAQGPPFERNVLDRDAQGIKRKNETEDEDSKRTRQKTAESEPSSSTSGTDRNSVQPAAASATPARSRPRIQPSRRKIEYVPLAREMDTYGGRDLRAIEEERAHLAQRRPLRDINDWGTVDIEALTMSIRSRLSTELSYALTTFTLLSTMRGQTEGSGFPIFQCPDLLDELLDLLEDEAFDGDADVAETPLSDDAYIVTHRDLLNTVRDEESQPFASLEQRQGVKNPDLGPKQRRGNIILAVSNILRNLSIIEDNSQFLARHPRMLDLLLRTCRTVGERGGPPRAVAPMLSLTDLITIRKDALSIIINVGAHIRFPSPAAPSADTLRLANRMFELIASFLVDPTDSVSPVAWLKQVGLPSSGILKPPSSCDVALEAFTRLAQLDSNRQVLSKAISQARLWQLFEALVHRLPIVENDYQLLGQEPWLSYLEKNVMALYSLAFLAPPDLKAKIKTDRSLSFCRVVIRMVQKCLVYNGAQSRQWFFVAARRAVEAMKLIDDGDDAFDTTQSTGPTMAFGMGYGEVDDQGAEKGTGVLGGYRDVTWDILLQRDVDDVMFSALESLARVEW